MGGGSALNPQASGADSRGMSPQEPTVLNGLTWGNSPAMRHGTLNFYRDQKKGAAR